VGRSRRTRSRSRARRWLWRLFLLVLFCAVVADAWYLGTLWPDWGALASGPPPRSAFMRAYESSRARRPERPPVDWRPVPLDMISPHLQRAVVVAEDSRFWRHEGVDVEALREAFTVNLERKNLVFGGSTISQQTAKNLFLTRSRDPLRKWHELVLTLVMEQRLSKRRILELYVNVAEFGPGVYGAEAAAWRYFAIPASALSPRQAAELAATLPSPRRHNPSTATRTFQSRRDRILAHIEAARAASAAP
jgi:monofunctional biosynthetic peptidoglycan transglycosylase